MYFIQLINVSYLRSMQANCLLTTISMQFIGLCPPKV